MPTRESAASFDKLVETRTRLNEISVELTKALERRRSGLLGDEQYRQLQKRWDDAFCDFEKATQEFAAIVVRLRRPEV